MSISAERLLRPARLFMLVLMACAGSAQAQELPAWLVLPGWQLSPDTVAKAEGPGTVPQVPRPGSRVFDQDFMLSTPLEIGTVPSERQFYFDRNMRLTVVRIMPTPSALSTANCDALLAATQFALGTPDETGMASPVETLSFDNAYWFRKSEDRVYRWVRMRAKGIPDNKMPCHLLVEPYEAGMKRKTGSR